MKALKNIIITHAVMLALFGGAAMAFAQETSSSTAEVATSSRMTPEEREARAADRASTTRENIAERKEAAEAKRTEIKEVREEKRIELKTTTKNRLTNLAANISNRMETVIDRIQNITDRIASRIAKLKEKGVDTEAAEAALASAQISIDAAMDEIENIDAEVAAAISSENVRANWADVRETYSVIKNHIMTARTELRASVAALKQAVQDLKDGKTTDREADESEEEAEQATTTEPELET